MAEKREFGKNAANMQKLALYLMNTAHSIEVLASQRQSTHFSPYIQINPVFGVCTVGGFGMEVPSFSICSMSCLMHLYHSIYTSHLFGPVSIARKFSFIFFPFFHLKRNINNDGNELRWKCGENKQKKEENKRDERTNSNDR